MTNKRLACATSCYGHNCSIERILRGIASSGYAAVEIMSIPHWFEHVMPENMDSASIESLKQKLKSEGLKLASISGHCELGRPEGLEQLKRRIEFAAEMGVKVVSTGTGVINNSDEEKRFYDSIGAAAEFAGSIGVSIALETGGNYATDGKKTAEIVDRVDSSHLGINYDPANAIAWGGANPLEDVKHVVHRLIHVHIKDQMGGAGVEKYPVIGDGEVDFNRFFRILADNGYTGDFGVEVDLPRGKSAEEADKMVARSLQFILHETNFAEFFQ